MAYTKLEWVNDDAPALSAANLNHMENGINDLYTLLGGLDRSGVELLVQFITRINARASAEGITAAEMINRIPYSNAGLPSASASGEYSTLSGETAS